MGALRIRWIVLAVLALLPASALVCLSAPGLPAKGKLADDTLSLAGISEVRLDIAPLTRRLRERGLTEEGVARMWTDSLEAAGIVVVEEDPAAPVLRLETKASVEEGLTGTCFAAYLKVIQPVVVERLDRRLMVPTYVFVMGGMDSAAQLARTARASLNILVNGFIDRVELATEEGG